MEENKGFNRFLIGLGFLTIGIGLYLFNNKKLQKEVKKSIKNNDSVKILVENDVVNKIEDSLDELGKIMPQEFKDSIDSMEINELKRTLKANLVMMNDNALSSDDKLALEKMLRYIELKINSYA